MTGRHARRVRPCDEPGRDIALGQRAAHRPVRVVADRRRERDVRDAAREIVAAEQLLRAVERAGRQQIELTGERHAGEEVGGNPIGHGRLHLEGTERVVSARGLIRQERVGHRDVFENAATQMAQPPGRLAVIVVGLASLAIRCRNRR